MSIESLGGYRLVRRLGEGKRAEVFLVRPFRDEPGITASVMKLYRPETADESILREIEALSRAAGEHVVALLDVSNAPGGAPAIIMQRLTALSLGRVLSDRSNLRPGEAITILAPIALAIERLHLAGVAHGGIGAETVLFDPSGAPVLACFGRAVLIPPGLPVARLEQQADVTADVLAFAGLASTVLGLVHDDATARLAADIVGEQPRPGWLGMLAERLFDLGPAQAVDLAPAPPSTEQRLPSRVVTGAPVAGHDEPAGSFTLSAIMERLAAHDLVPRVRNAVALVRPRVWVIAGAVGAALVAALVAIPPESSSDSTHSTTTPPTPAASAGAIAAGPTADAGADPVGGDDPVAALSALLAARERCIRDLSVLCLEAVDQEGSAALDDDRALVRSLQDGAEIPTPVEAGGAALTERLGDSAIIALSPDSEPASILVMRGEAGWRIRDYVGR